MPSNGSNGSCKEPLCDVLHHHSRKDNFCNFTEFSFGSKDCRCVNQHLRAVASVRSSHGYVLPYDAKIKAISWSFDKGPCVGHGERIVLQVDGSDTNIEINIDNSTSNKGVLKGLDLRVQDGSCINTISRYLDETPWDDTCDIIITVLVEMKCKRKPRYSNKPCQVSLFEAYDSIGGQVLSTTNIVMDLDTVRTDLDDGDFFTWDGSLDELAIKEGVYIIDYKSAYITIDRSSNVFHLIELEIDMGAGFVAYPGSRIGSHDLAGEDGGGMAAGAVTLVVPKCEEYKVRLVAKVTDDSTICETPDQASSLLVERLSCSEKYIDACRMPRKGPNPLDDCGECD